jgi:hypothetical protein
MVLPIFAGYAPCHFSGYLQGKPISQSRNGSSIAVYELDRKGSNTQAMPFYTQPDGYNLLQSVKRHDD